MSVSGSYQKIKDKYINGETMNKLNKIALLILVAAVIGMSTPVMFSIGGGQHQFQQIDPENPDAFCEKCHGGDMISTELGTSGDGLYNGGGQIHAGVRCIECHAVTQRNQTIFTANTKTEHAAVIPTCTGCHTVGGSGAVMGDVLDELNQPTEAHNQFSDSTACIACHTSISVNGAIDYTYSGAVTRFGLTIG